MFASEWWLYAVPLGWKIRRHDSGRTATDGSALFFRLSRAASKASWLVNASLKLEGGLLGCCNAISLADGRD